MTTSMTIDCGECVMRATQACDDCVVSFVMEREPGTALVIDVAEAEVLVGNGGADGQWLLLDVIWPLLLAILPIELPHCFFQLSGSETSNHACQPFDG